MMVIMVLVSTSSRCSQQWYIFRYKQVVYIFVLLVPYHGTRGTPNPLSHADFVATKMALRWLRIYESVSKVLNDPPLVRRE